MTKKFYTQIALLFASTLAIIGCSIVNYLVLTTTYYNGELNFIGIISGCLLIIYVLINIISIVTLLIGLFNKNE